MMCCRRSTRKTGTNGDPPNPMMCRNVLANFFWSSVLDLCTLVQWNNIEVCKSDLALFEVCRHCVVRVWYSFRTISINNMLPSESGIRTSYRLCGTRVTIPTPLSLSLKSRVSILQCMHLCFNNSRYWRPWGHHSCVVWDPEHRTHLG